VTAPTHFTSHADLLRRLQPGSMPLGGVVVPSIRPAEHLRFAMSLAADLGVPIVVLCSGLCLPRAVVELAKTIRGARCTAIDMVSLKAYANMPAFATETERFADATDGAYGDLSLKRNLGLLIGRLAGWRTLLFLDDDMTGLSAAKVRRAAGALGECVAAGMPARDFPDNSVVCHARRRFAGAAQDVFVSGSALVVNVDTADSFFPAVYNEDWLFLAPHLDRRTVTSGGPSHQKPYYPFDSPDRAVRQEFGDVLAEGLIGHLHTGGLAVLPSRKDWARFLSERADVIAAGLAGCRENKLNPMARDAAKALAEADQRRRAIEATTLVDYLEAWRSDLTTWRRHIRTLESVGSLDKALAELGLQASALTTDSALRRWRSYDDRLLDVMLEGVSSPA
jgi:hypothetical protein